MNKYADFDAAVPQTLGIPLIGPFIENGRVAACCGSMFGPKANMCGMRLAFTKKRQPRTTGRFKTYDSVARSLKLNKELYATVEYFVADGKTMFQGQEADYYNYKLADHDALGVVEDAPGVHSVYLNGFDYVTKHGITEYDRKTGAYGKKFQFNEQELKEYLREKTKAGDYLFSIFANRLGSNTADKVLKTYFLDNPDFKEVKTPINFANAYHADTDNKLTLHVLQRV